MDFVWFCCLGRIDITKVCFVLDCCEALTDLGIHHLTPQPTTKRLLHCFLVLLKLEIDHIQVKSYEVFGVLPLTGEVSTVVGYDSNGLVFSGLVEVLALVGGCLGLSARKSQLGETPPRICDRGLLFLPDTA